ncbi:MAG: glycosyl transferase family 2 protein [Parcubacteria group bacterium Licking1014_17]|nr:MAG: glycosyl transferase family 2 protein [Parcubacteria group bacterium Licking1014_17]
MPRVSIIIPAFNSAKNIKRTIESVSNQSFRDWELIVVDDGSTDNTKEIISEFQNNDPRIRYIYQENSGGPAGPKNTGIKNSIGELIAFLDHDDEWLPKKLEKQVYLMDHPRKNNTALVGCDAFIIDELHDEERIYRITKSENYLEELLVRNVIFCSSGVIVKRSVLSDVGYFDEQFRFGDDWDMWLRIAQKYSLDFIHEPLYKYYRHAETVTSKLNIDNRINEYEFGLSKHLPLYKKYRKAHSNHLLIMGRMCYPEKRREALVLFWNALKINPVNIRAYANLLFLLVGEKAYRLFLRFRSYL